MAFDFGYRLKFLRKKKKLSQKQVADRVHVSKASISGYENNLTMPSVDVLVRLALLYGVSTDYLTGLDNRKMVNLDGFMSADNVTEKRGKGRASMGQGGKTYCLCGIAATEGGKRQRIS